MQKKTLFPFKKIKFMDFKSNYSAVKKTTLIAKK